MNQFGSTSKERLNTCQQDLVKIFELAITRSNIDFGISQGARTWEQQLDYFQQGKSKLDPRLSQNKTRAKHVTGNGWRELSEAVDIYIYHPDYETRKKLAYDIPSLAYVAGVVQSCAKELLVNGEITHIVRWGGNWDMDGIILKDQSFDDMPHFELRKP
ncbi:MAG: hypothetical protein ACPGD8_00945 [Flavobacteriales bacterium]